MMRRACVLLALCLCACKSAEPATQVMVLIDSAAGVRASIASVELEVKSGEGAEHAWPTRLQKNVVPGKDGVRWPIELALVPGPGGVSGSYAVTATAKDAKGAVLGEVRAISGYVAHRKLALLLRFDDACFARAEPCGEPFTCSEGVCRDAHVDASLLPPYERDGNGHPVLVPFAPPELDGGADADAGPHDALDAAVLEACGELLCDELAGCVQDGTQSRCGACPSGFVGEAQTGCSASLLGLSLSAGSTTPALTSDVTRYVLELPLLASTLTLTPEVPKGASLEIAGEPLDADGRWTSGLLELGSQRVPLRVTYPGHESRSYTLELMRSGRQDAFVKTLKNHGDDWFGSRVALSGNTLVVGALYEDSGATGVNGDPDDDSVQDSGAVFVLERDAKSFSHSAYLKADVAEEGALFGSDVAIDGDTLVVGAEHLGGVGGIYVFVRSGKAWKKQALLTVKGLGAESALGRVVAISGDTLAAGAPGDDTIGLDSGGAFVWKRSAGSWSGPTRLAPDEPGPADWHGSSVAIGDAGDTIVVGATGASIGDVAAGVAYVFEADGAGGYAQAAVLTGETPQALSFTGDSVAISGGTIVVGGFNRNQGRGEALVFEKSGSGPWKRSATLDAGDADHFAVVDDNFGSRVAIAGDIILIGAGGEDSAGSGVMAPGAAASGDPVIDSGGAYLFQRSGASWSALAHLKAAHPGTAESFGWAVALSDELVVVGAQDEKSDGTALGADETRDGAPSSGAVYVFR